MGILISGCFVQIMMGAFDWGSDALWGFETAIMGLVGIFMFIVSFPFPIGETKYEIRNATNTRMGDGLIIQAEGYPTQISTHLGFEERELQIKKVEYYNAWGHKLGPGYEVILKPEVE